MTITFFKSRCLICLKGFQVPLRPNSSYPYRLYYDKITNTFHYFNWFDNNEIDNCVTDFLSKIPEIQFLNDETKGTTSWQIVGLIADGNNELVVGYNRCPRCGLKFNSVLDTKTETKKIETLRFIHFLSLDNNARQKYFIRRTEKTL